MSDLLSRCPTCRNMLDDEDLFCANCGAEAPTREEHPPAFPARLITQNFVCQGCGAGMSYDASAATLRCPFCGSTRLEKHPDKKELSAQRVVPFLIHRQQAEASMRSWLGQGFWRPANLSSEALVVNMTPVFVPYWVFECSTSTFWTADSSETPAGARSSWYPRFGTHRSRYTGTLVGASSVLTQAETAAISPFDLSKGVPPIQVDLDNIVVETFRCDRRYARPLARQGFEESERHACIQHVPGRARNLKVNVLIDGLSSEPILLPVWVMAYRYQDRVFRFLLNGQTGKATGAAPFSWGKLAVVLGIVLGILLLLAAFMGLAAFLANANRN